MPSEARNIDLLCDGYVPDDETGVPAKGISQGAAEGNVSEKARAGFRKFDELAGINPGEKVVPTPMEIKKAAEKKGLQEGLMNKEST
jgi:hypothetical protein